MRVWRLAIPVRVRDRRHQHVRRFSRLKSTDGRPPATEPCSWAWRVATARALVTSARRASVPRVSRHCRISSAPNPRHQPKCLRRRRDVATSQAAWLSIPRTSSQSTLRNLGLPASSRAGRTERPPWPWGRSSGIRLDAQSVVYRPTGTRDPGREILDTPEYNAIIASSGAWARSLERSRAQ
jgi:hypothetical protein